MLQLLAVVVGVERARSTRLRVEGLKPCHTLATRAPKSSIVIIQNSSCGPEVADRPIL